jgi:hypothetical protein
MNMRTKYLIGAGAGALALALVAVGTASAAGLTGQFTKPAAMGTVSAVNGESITLTGKNGTPYTVDATNATITKSTPGSNGVKGTSATITASQIQTGDTLSVSGTVSGDSIAATQIRDGKFMGRGQMAKPAINGTVSAVNGNSVTVTGKNGTTYTVDATSAKINKITPGATGAKPTSAVITVSGISVGDTVMVQGTVSGSSVTATRITDGNLGNRAGGRGSMTKPAAMGTVSAVNGNNITLAGKNGTTTYTVDATNAAITKFTPGASGAKGTSATITISQIQSGDTLIVQGTVSGNSVTATKIMDGTFMRGGFGHGHSKTATPAQ